MSRVLIIVLVCLVLSIMLNYELTVKPEFEIIQTSLGDFQLKMLYEKMPVIIQDRIVELGALIKHCFKYQYMGSIQSEKPAPYKVLSNIGRFAVLQGSQTRNKITLKNPMFENEAAIVLEQHQVLIIPRKWAYTVDEGSIKQVILRDLVSYLFG